MPRTSTFRVCSLLAPLAAALRIAPDERAADPFLTMMAHLANNPPKIDREAVWKRIMEEVPVAFKEDEMGIALPTYKRTTPRKSFKRCAVVSNSRAVLKAKAGADIDGVDGPVFRINDVVTKGFEAQVGQRKDVLIINDQLPCQWMVNKSGPSKRVKTVILNDFDNTFGEGIQFLYPACMRYVLTIPNIRVRALDYQPFTDSFMRIILEEIVIPSQATLRAGRAAGAAISLQRAFLDDPPWASSGMVAMVVALNMCKEVLHYGFTTLDDCSESYWQNTSTTSCHHDIMHHLAWEHLLMRMLSNKTKVTGEGVLRGWPEHPNVPEDEEQTRRRTATWWDKVVGGQKQEKEEEQEDQGADLGIL